MARVQHVARQSGFWGWGRAFDSAVTRRLPAQSYRSPMTSWATRAAVVHAPRRSTRPPTMPGWLHDQPLARCPGVALRDRRTLSHAERARRIRARTKRRLRVPRGLSPRRNDSRGARTRGRRAAGASRLACRVAVAALPGAGAQGDDCDWQTALRRGRFMGMAARPPARRAVARRATLRRAPRRSCCSRARERDGHHRRVRCARSRWHRLPLHRESRWRAQSAQCPRPHQRRPPRRDDATHRRIPRRRAQHQTEALSDLRDQARDARDADY